jgi:hypothetical protein
MTSTGENTVDSAKRHLEPLVQLLQWLQCLSSLGENLESLVGTLQQLPRLSPEQLLHAAKYYRPEVGESNLPKSASKYIVHLQKAAADRKAARAKSPNPQQPPLGSAPSTPVKPTAKAAATPSPAPSKLAEEDVEDTPNDLLLDPSYMLPFSLPTSTDMLITYGAGFGGVNKEQERKYIPTVPPEFLAKLDLGGGNKNVDSLYNNNSWEESNYG